MKLFTTSKYVFFLIWVVVYVNSVIIRNIVLMKTNKSQFPDLTEEANLKSKYKIDLMVVAIFRLTVYLSPLQEELCIKI